jgi:hypothetical protein
MPLRRHLRPLRVDITRIWQTFEGHRPNSPTVYRLTGECLWLIRYPSCDVEQDVLRSHTPTYQRDAYAPRALFHHHHGLSCARHVGGVFLEQLRADSGNCIWRSVGSRSRLRILLNCSSLQWLYGSFACSVTMENDLEVANEEERKGRDSTCHVYGCLVSLPTSISTSRTKLCL